MTALEKFKQTIPDCNCHCRECCKCDRPHYYISIDKKLLEDPKNDPEIKWAMRMMDIPGAIGIITTHTKV